MDKQEAQEHAKNMREFAKKHLASGLKRWCGEPEMIAMVRGDAKDFREVAKLLRVGKIKQAFAVAGGMDTAPREQIPNDIWNAMHDYVYPENN